jgi:uncharacterized glyoxalase superfamily protein PhnB
VPAAGPVHHLAVDQDLEVLTAQARKHGARVSRRVPGATGAAALADPYGNDWVFFARQPGAVRTPPAAPLPTARRSGRREAG